jgi:hypothetical protein
LNKEKREQPQKGTKMTKKEMKNKKIGHGFEERDDGLKSVNLYIFYVSKEFSR